MISVFCLKIKNYFDAIDPVDAEDGHEVDTLLGFDVTCHDNATCTLRVALPRC